MTRSTVANGLLIGIGVGLLLVSVPARANTIPPCSSDCLTVFNGNTPPGQVYQVSATESQEKNDPGRIFFIDVQGLANSDMVNSPTIILDPSGKISDVFGVVPYSIVSKYSNSDNNSNNDYNGNKYNKDNKDGNDAVLAFISDPTKLEVEDICGDTGDKDKKLTCTFLTEGTGGPFSATKYLSDDFLKDHSGYTAIFKSDSEVPEPATTGLFCGLGALGLCVWKRRRTAA